MKRESFIFYKSFADAIDDLPDNEQLLLYKAIKEFSLNGIEIDLQGQAKTLWKLIKPQLIANNKKFNDGTKGGRPKNKPLVINNENQWLSEQETSGYENEKPNENENENENGSFSDFGFKYIPEEGQKARENATTFFNARNLWNELQVPPECRDIIIPHTQSECLRTLQNYSWPEIENAIKNYHFHKTKCDNDWKPPPPYGSLYGFLKTGVERYYDDKAFEQQFKEK
jgi:hypothetical protein